MPVPLDRLTKTGFPRRMDNLRTQILQAEIRVFEPPEGEAPGIMGALVDGRLRVCILAHFAGLDSAKLYVTEAGRLIAGLVAAAEHGLGPLAELVDADPEELAAATVEAIGKWTEELRDMGLMKLTEQGVVVAESDACLCEQCAARRTLN